MTMSLSILTIGYGGRSTEDLLTTLKTEGVRFLIDVRSNPISRFNPEFSADPLREKLEASGIRYVSMGDTLGGRPKDQTCYENGHVIYERVQEKRFFKVGIDRLLRAHAKGIRVCLLCSEIRPEDCHRSKMIGASLENQGIEVVHLGPQGEHLTQAQVMARLETGQTEMFANGLRSRKSYRPMKRAVGGSH
jgi:uncharacterized protein (DUF488 family)